MEGTAPLGTLHVRTPDSLAWCFTGVRVLGARGDVVTVESADGPRRSYTGAPAVPCGNLVRVSPPEPAERTHTDVTFVGCSPRGGLRDALAAGAPEPEAVRYQVLDALGSVHHEAAAGRITGWDASPRAHDLVDLTVAFPREGLVPHPVREVWELWRHARPAEPGTWRRFTGAPRAIGELLAGTTLVRRRAEVARRCLGVLPYAEGRPPTFGELADGLTAAGVRLVLG